MSDESWVGVDLDGCLAHYDGWDDGKIGKPVPLMLARVKGLLAQGQQVKIFTARAGVPELIPPIKAWLVKHGLPELNPKPDSLIELKWHRSPAEKS